MWQCHTAPDNKLHICTIFEGLKPMDTIYLGVEIAGFAFGGDIVLW